MEVTLESVKESKAIYEATIKQIMANREKLTERVRILRQDKRTSKSKTDIAEKDFEEIKLVQEIGQLMFDIKDNELRLEQIMLQQDRLESKIDAKAFSKGMNENRQKKATLEIKRELEYCENEVEKCEKAITFYTLKGDKENVDKWKKELEKAQKELEYAKADYEKEITLNQEGSKKETSTREEQTTQQGAEPENDIFVEKFRQTLKNYSVK